MAKPKKKFTAAQRAEKKRRKKEFMTVFMNGKQVRVRRPPTVDGMDVENFIRQNADPIWLHHHGYHEILHERDMEEQEAGTDSDAVARRNKRPDDLEEDIPF